jgi:Protein of unknown function (DUF1822)
MTNSLTETLTIKIPLTMADRAKAEKFAEEQLTPAAQARVRQNTLAVAAVHTYLQWMDVNVDLDRSHSHMYQERLLLDAADLYLPGIGRLECRVIQDDGGCVIPPSAQSQRLGCVGVAIAPNHCEAQLIGFKAAGFDQRLATDRLNRGDFEDLDELLLALDRVPVRLRSWLEQQFEAAWQSWEELREANITLTSPQFACLGPIETTTAATRGPEVEALLQQIQQLQNVEPQNEEKRWQLVEQLWKIAPDHPAVGVRRISDLGVYIAGAKVALMVAVLPNPDGRLSVLLRVYPMEQACLPIGLQVTGIDAAGTKFLSTTAREQDNCIQYKLIAELDEQFSIRINYGDEEYTEQFVA